MTAAEPLDGDARDRRSALFLASFGGVPKRIRDGDIKRSVQGPQKAMVLANQMLGWPTESERESPGHSSRKALKDLSSWFLAKARAGPAQCVFQG